MTDSFYYMTDYTNRTRLISVSNSVIQRHHASVTPNALNSVLFKSRTTVKYRISMFDFQELRRL